MTQMNLVRFVLPLLFPLVAVPDVHAGMRRVVAVEDAQTIVVDAASPTRIRLAGIEVVDGEGARRFLEATLASAWVAGEKRADGYMIWRSPDGMFINRELVVRGYARGVSSELEPPRNYTVTYLGQLNPALTGPRPAISAPPGTGSGSVSRRPARRSPQRRPSPRSRKARAH